MWKKFNRKIRFDLKFVLGKSVTFQFTLKKPEYLVKWIPILVPPLSNSVPER